jgi:EAL domain-containing protein (putative c-di-GMP-specific phosphodiesterase class I)
VKLDRYFIHGCADDRRRRALIESVQHIGVSLGCAVIAEGVERMEDLLTLRAMNISLVQGYLLAVPGAPPAVASWGQVQSRKCQRMASLSQPVEFLALSTLDLIRI